MAIGLVALVLAIALALTAVLQATLVRTRAQTVADLAALAAAQAVLDGASLSAACQRAAAVATRHRAILAACHAAGHRGPQAVGVRVRVDGVAIGFGSLAARASAVAGRRFRASVGSRFARPG